MIKEIIDQLVFSLNVSKIVSNFCGFTVEDLSMVEKWRESLNSGGNFGALLTDLSKAFDCLSHIYFLLSAKLHSNGLDIPSLKLLHPYLTKKRQRVKMNNIYSSWSEILFGVPQGSILGSLLFNIFCVMIILTTPPINILKLY